MNLLRVSFAAASHKTFRHFATASGNLESKMNRRINNMSKTEELSHAVVEVLDRTRAESPNETTYTSLIDSLCKHDMFDDAYRVLNEMFVSGFSPSFVTLKDVLGGFLRIGDMKKAFEMRYKIYQRFWWENNSVAHLWLIQDLSSDEVTYTSLMNAYLDEGKCDTATHFFYSVSYRQCFPCSVLYRVLINGLDKKARTRTVETNKYLLRFNYENCLGRPILEYGSTMAHNSTTTDDEFKSVVELVEGICSKGLENVFDTMLKSNYKPYGIDDDGIVYNLFIIAHCKHYNVDEAYIMYKEMVHYGFACHMFTVFALIKTLKRKNMVNELLWVIQNVLRSCNLNHSDILKFLNEFNPKEPENEAFFDWLAEKAKDKEPENEALFDVLAEKAKDGLFLKCSYAQRGDFDIYNTLINDKSKAEELSRADQTRQVKRLSPNKTTYTCLIDSFCNHDRFDVAYRVLNEMIVSGFSPSFLSLNNVLRGFIRIGDMRNAYEMLMEMDKHLGFVVWMGNGWMDEDTETLLFQGLSDEVTYTSLMNAYFDEGKFHDAEELYQQMNCLDKFIDNNELTHISSLPDSVRYSVFSNGRDKKDRTNKLNSLEN